MNCLWGEHMEAIKYSQYGLIQEELKLLGGISFSSGLLSFLTRNMKLKFQLSVPNDLYQRADVLCDDILQMRSANKEYRQGELVEHIFLDFLDEVRKHDGNVGAIYNRLNVRKQQLPLVNDKPLIASKSSTSIQTKIHRDDVLRAEVLLKDLSYFVPSHGLSVEELIEIVYLDFLLEYTKGRRKNVLKEILETID
jgi:hypothetical protein